MMCCRREPCGRASSRDRSLWGSPHVSQEREDGKAKQFYQEVSRTVMDRIASLGAVESPVQQSSAGIRKAE